ncbi:hypothetical protein LB504_005152 [Fusarium proliferatum]|nr:hypothetical protein LB504_005152 [Fusarium proliferatum]
MDPFTRIPAELRLQIFSYLQSKATLSSILEASPVLCEQYLEFKSTIIRNLLERDFDDGMIQDAMAIILFPSLREARKSRKRMLLVEEHLNSWEGQELPNPFVTRDALLMKQLDKLHSLLMMFVEDYITKATAAFPPREYICLPQPTHIQSYLMFKGEKVTKRFDSCHLQEGERRRFMRAFLRVELSSLVYKALSFTSGNRALFGKVARKLTRRRMEEFQCVWTYASSLYGALFAHCGDAWLPEADAPPETGLLFPDTLFVDPVKYGRDVGIRSREMQVAVRNMACYGFPLIVRMIRFATARPKDTEPLDNFVKRLCSFEMDHSLRMEDHFILARFSRGPIQGPAEPAWWESLNSQLSSHDTTQIKIFQQRAWPFFDDDRHYPKDTGALSLFPKRPALLKMERERLDASRTFSGHGPISFSQMERTCEKFRRSQKWQDKISARSLMSNREVSLPEIGDQGKLLAWNHWQRFVRRDGSQ